MNHDIKVPSPGESVSGGILAKWLKPDGASVAEGEDLFELETDKATMTVPASVAGILTHGAAEGTEVTVGQTVGTVAGGSGAPAPAAAPVSPQQPHPVEPDRGLAELGPPKQDKGGPVPPPAPAPRPQPTGRVTRERMSSLRKRIAENLVQSQRHAAHLSTFNEIDLDRFMAIRKQYGEAFEKRHGVKLGFMSMFVKAACRALADFPGVNAVVDGDDIVFNHFYNIGVAVTTERGLMVPVLRDADQKSFAAIESEIKNLAERARDRKLSVDDLSGGTFTITNGGIFGSLLSTPIPTPPQTAILGMHTIQKRPVVVNDAIVIRPMMYVALTYDHRVIDGKDAVGFLVKVKQVIEDPDSLLFGL